MDECLRHFGYPTFYAERDPHVSVVSCTSKLSLPHIPEENVRVSFFATWSFSPLSSGSDLAESVLRCGCGSHGNEMRESNNLSLMPC